MTKIIRQLIGMMPNADGTVSYLYAPKYCTLVRQLGLQRYRFDWHKTVTNKFAPHQGERECARRRRQRGSS